MKITVMPDGTVREGSSRSMKDSHAAVLSINVEGENVNIVKNHLPALLVKKKDPEISDMTVSAWLISGSKEVIRKASFYTDVDTSAIHCVLLIKPTEKDHSNSTVSFPAVTATGHGETTDEAFSSAYRELLTRFV